MMDLPVCYAVPTEITSPKWCAAFAAGCGGSVVEREQLLRGQVALFGSPMLHSLLQDAQTRGRTWYYGDHAYFGRRQFYRCTRGAMQHDGVGEADPARFQAFGIPILPWRRNGNHLLLCPNSEEFLQRDGYERGEWLSRTQSRLRLFTDRPIRVRWKTDGKPLADDLANCWAVVTYTSNAAVEAVLAGVPVFCTKACAALTMGSQDLAGIENPRMPEGRLQWASVLASNQWSLIEMMRGDLWRAIGTA